MNLIKRILLVAIAVAAAATTASAQFRIGPRVGIDVNSLRFNESVFNSDNRVGFTGGIQAEFTVPVINLAFDASVMYTRRNSESAVSATDEDGNIYKSRDYISIPVNFKYKFGLPVVGKVLSPYIFTGPEFAFLASKRAAADAWNQKKVDVAWNVGLGLQLFTHLQIGASYGFGITKVAEKISPVDGKSLDGKNKYWTVTAAWLF
jgi:hypothetical protein